MQRLIIQMAFAADLSGQNLQGAAEEAMRRALSQVALPAPDVFGLLPEDIETRITIGVPDMAQIDLDALERVRPQGPGHVRCVLGGQRVQDTQTGGRHDVATAAVEVFLPRQRGWALRGGANAEHVVSTSEAP